MSPFSRPAAVRHGDRMVARSVLFVLLAFYTATFVGVPENPDAEVEFQTTSSLVRRHTLALGGTPEAAAIAAHRYSVHGGGPGREEELFAWFGVGQAYGGVPFYLAGRGLGRIFPDLDARHGTTPVPGVSPDAAGRYRSEYFEHLLVGWRNPLLGALTALLVVLTSIRLGASRRHAWLAGLAYGLGTYAWPQARSTLSDVQAAFFLFLAFHMLLKVRESYRRYLPPRRIDMALYGLGLAAAFLTRLVTAPAILVLLVAGTAVVAHGRRRPETRGFPTAELAWMGLPAAGGLVVWLAVNHLRFGRVLESGYGEVVGASFFDFPFGEGILSLLVSPGRGLLFLAPAVVLAPVWLGRLVRSGGDPLAGWTVAAVAAAVIGPVALAGGWHGAWTYGPRYVLPLLPFLWLGVAPTLDRLAARRAGRLVALALLGAGLVTSLPGVLVDYPTHHDLAVQAARLEWPDVAGPTEEAREGARFLSIQYDWRFAAPWAHWRILRHRIAVGDERYPVREVFLLDRDEVLSPTPDRSTGLRHLAWVDLHERLGGAAWPAVLLCLAFLGAGIVLAGRGLDPDLR
ncbi:MAG: phospholipid carrier-dependent glycosyltransferase [Planctomycetota bacterium]